MLGDALLTLILSLLSLPALNFTPILSDNYNQSFCSELSIGAPIIRLTPTNNNHFLHDKLQVLESFPLKRYEFIDSDYPISALNSQDEALVRNYQTPPEVFHEHKIVIENYQLLTQREFQITIVNPSTSLNFCIREIYIDIPEIKRVQHRKLPFCVNRKTKYPFTFKILVQESKQRILKCGVFMIVDLKDSSSQKFIQQKLWGKQVVIKISPNWLKLSGSLNFNLNPLSSFQMYQLINPTSNDLIIDVSSSTNLLGLGNLNPTESKLSRVELKKSTSLKISIQHKSGQLIIHCVNNLKLENIKIVVSLRNGFSIDPINIGILPSKRVILETYIYATNMLKQSVVLKQIQLFNRVKTVYLHPIQSFNAIVPAGSVNYPIAVLRICPGLGEDQLIRNSIKVVYTSNSSGYLQVAEGVFSFYEIVNPISSMQKRFFYLEKGLKVKRRFQDTLFQLKNSLNVPLKLSNVVVDQNKFKISWLSDKREYIYPNHPNVLFGIQYISEQVLSLPSSSQTLLLHFNNNILIPVELVLYDKTLECRYMNVSNRCTNYERVDLGNLRSNINNTREFVIINSNPTPLKLVIKPLKTNNHTSIRVIGPLPSAENYTRFLNSTIVSTLKNRMSLAINFSINCREAGYYSEVISVNTDEQSFNIQFTYRLSEGMLTLHPNPLVIMNNHQPKSSLIYMVSTFPEEYTLLSVETNITELSIKQSSYQYVKPHEVREINIQFTPKLTQVLSFSNILSLIQNSHKHQYIRGYIKIKTSQDLEQSAQVVIPNFPTYIMPKRHIKAIEIVERSINNKLLIKVQNQQNITLKLKVALIDPEFVKHYGQAKKVMQRSKKKSSFYICLSEGAKSKLKLTPAIIRSLLHLDTSPTQVFIEALEDGRFYIQWHHREEFKSFESLQKEVERRVLISIIGGSRYCFKGEAATYFKQLFNTEQFIRVMQSGDSTNFFQFVDREYQNFVNPSLVLQFDHFYKNLNISSSKCFFKFCTYVPIEYSQDEYFLDPDYHLNITLNIKQSLQQLRPVAFTVISNIGQIQTDFLEFKNLRKAMTVESVTANNITTPIEELLNHTTDTYLPLQITELDYRSGQIKGQRSFRLKNVGDTSINITSVLIEDTLSPEQFEGFQVVDPDGFNISEGEIRDLQIRFQFSNIPMKPINIYFYCPSNYFFKIKILALPGPIRYRTQTQSFYLIIGLTVLSTTYIILILRIVIKEKNQLNKKPIPTYKTPNLAMRRPMTRLNFEYVNKLKEIQSPKQKQPQNNVQEEQQYSQKSDSIIRNIQEVQSVQASRESQQSKQYSNKDEDISVDDKSEGILPPSALEEENKEDNEPYKIIKNNDIDSESSLGSGSSLSDDIFAEINNFAATNNSKWDNSNSDKADNESNDSLKFYNAFLSGGPLLLRQNSQEEFFEDQKKEEQPQP